MTQTPEPPEQPGYQPPPGYAAPPAGYGAPPPGFGPPPPGFGPPPPYGQQFAQPYPYQAPMSNGFGVTALVLGIIALLFGLFPFTFFIAIPLGITAIVFGVLGRKRAARGEANNGGMATAGFVCAIVGIVASVAWVALLVIGLSTGSCDQSDTYTGPDGQTGQGFSVNC